ncbi:DsbA family oxidoreductase [Acetobacteraceae bacterium H6797]|nr:DsbA family oxidoreductase [Acetobacteraceae bacterium H6797]
MSQPLSTPLNGRIDVISDVVCPWCWVGKRHLATALDILAAEGLHFDVGYRAFRLNPDMPEGGMDRAEYRRQKFGSVERGKELDARITGIGQGVGLDFQFERITRSPVTRDAHRLIALAAPTGRQLDLVEALFGAYFRDGKDIGDRQVLADLAAGPLGLDRDAVLEFLASGEGAEAMEAEDMGFRRAGISGVPSFLLDGHLLTSGAVPGEDLAAMIKQGVEILRQRRLQSAAG